jgi:hypothetical protein
MLRIVFFVLTIIFATRGEDVNLSKAVEEMQVFNSIFSTFFVLSINEMNVRF